MFKEVLIKNNAPILEGITSPEANLPVLAANTPPTGSLLERLRNNRATINEKSFGKVSSFNFSRNVFYKGNWNDLTIKARGLFVNNENGNIVARGFEKFFAYKEGQFNSPNWLEQNLVFPVSVYKKYNGFLGVLGFDENGLMFCSKTTVGGEFAQNFERIFKMNEHNEETLLAFMKSRNVCLVFEVIDPVNDPHIVEYNKESIVLLDAIRLNEQFNDISYDALCSIAHEFKFIVKRREHIVDDWNSLQCILDSAENDKQSNMEGYVIVDANGYHFKLKTAWYRFWKWMRSMKDKIAAGRKFDIGGTNNDEAIRVLCWMKKQPAQWIADHSIIDIRKQYELEKSI